MPARKPTRRSVLTGLAASLASASTTFALPARTLFDGTVPTLPATARHAIYLYMAGGMSHVDTFDPKPNTPAMGSTRAIETAADGVRISHRFPLLAAQLDKAAVIRSLQSTQGAHAQGTYAMHTSYAPRATIRHPSLGAWATFVRGSAHPTLPAHVAIDAGQNMAAAGFFGSQHIPLPIGEPDDGLAYHSHPPGVTPQRIVRRFERLGAMNHAFRQSVDVPGVDAYADMYAQAAKLMGSDDLEAFDLTNEPDALRDAYGRDRFGAGCLLARRLVEHGVRWVEVVLGGWDMHTDIDDRLEELCPEADRGIATLIADLHARGMLDETLVVVATEFGRTPIIRDDRRGRDHHPQAFSGLLAGGGIAPGRAWGGTDEIGATVAEDGLTVQRFNATIARALGIDTEHVVTTREGRPFTVADGARPAMELFA